MVETEDCEEKNEVLSLEEDYVCETFYFLFFSEDLAVVPIFDDGFILSDYVRWYGFLGENEKRR